LYHGIKNFTDRQDLFLFSHSSFELSYSGDSEHVIQGGTAYIRSLD